MCGLVFFDLGVLASALLSVLLVFLLMRRLSFYSWLSFSFLHSLSHNFSVLSGRVRISHVIFSIFLFLFQSCRYHKSEVLFRGQCLLILLRAEGSRAAALERNANVKSTHVVSREVYLLLPAGMIHLHATRLGPSLKTKWNNVIVPAVLVSFSIIIL